MYGFIRLTFGSLCGFLVGCSEALENILVVSTSVQPIGAMITSVCGTSPGWEPYYWLIIHAALLVTCLSGDRFFWGFVRFIAVLFCLLIAVYIFGSFPFLNFDKYVTKRAASFQGYQILKIFPSGSWYFMGIELLPLSGSVMKDVSCVCYAAIHMALII
jgi:hypothetical protein